MTEGDIAIVFSQFGEIVDVNLVRDDKTGTAEKQRIAEKHKERMHLTSLVQILRSTI